MIEKAFESNLIGKKWTVTVICLIGIISTVIIASLAIVIVDNIDCGDHLHSAVGVETTAASKKSAKLMISVSAVITVLVDLLVTLGGYQQHYFMTLTYCLLMALIAVGSLLIGYRTECWYSTVLHFLILGLAYDLRIMRNKSFAPKPTQEAEPAHPQTQLHVVVCQSHSPPTPGQHYSIGTAEWHNTPGSVLPSYGDSTKKAF